MATDNPYRVKLVSRSPTKIRGYNKVVFEVSPELVETRTVNYSSYDPVHLPGQIFVYKNTQARTFSISGAKLLSRTPAEAEDTLQKLRMLRGWTMPRFGVNSTTAEGSGGRFDLDNSFELARTNNSNLFNDVSILQNRTSGELLGSPPEVLYFSAYSNKERDQTGTRISARIVNGHISNVPVVISSLTIPYPTDVDYIISEQSGTPVPTIITIDVSLLEAHSAREYEQFSLDDFKEGALRGF